MNEHYLHVIWNLKRIPFHRLTTTTGKVIEIVDVGTWNQESGPDFFAGKIRIDGIEYVGNIEMHVNSSDWLKHGHQFDSAYENVILHVVYEDDCSIFLNETPIPTISLKEHIDWKHYNQYKSVNGNPYVLPCASSLHEIPKIHVWEEVTRNAWWRVETKAHLFDATHRITDFREQLFRFIAISFGMKINNLAFEELANRIPVKQFLKAKSKEKHAICLGVSGLLEKFPKYEESFSSEWNFQKKRLNLFEMLPSAWKTKGHRPQGFPEKRLVQFAHLMHNMDWSSDFWLNDPKVILQELQKLLIQDVLVENNYVSGMNRNTANVILSNSIVPFLWWLSDWKKDRVYVEKAMQILELLPAEKNEITNQWASYSILPKNALESQGLIQLYNEKCKNKGCLNCKIGRYCMQ